MSIDPQEFAFIARLIKEKSGISLGEDKIYLLESRLQSIVRMHHLDSVKGLIQKLRQGADPALVNEVIEAMTTNESMFFRDQKPFQKLKDIVLPRLRQAKGTDTHLRIWSAACSNGQEAYSIALTLLENQGVLPGWSYEILGTDIAPKVIEKAKQGIYTQFEVQRGLPIQTLVKYFTQQEGNHWQLKEEVRRMVRFEIYNLLDDLGKFGKFDIIFCRNVLIYFDEETKKSILSRLLDAMPPHGVLFVGSTEAVHWLNDSLILLDNEPGLLKKK